MKKVLMIIGGLVLGIFLFVAIVYFIVSLTSEKLVCESDEGNITLMYNNETITGYTASGLTYDMDGQKKIVDRIGIEAYLDEFAKWFSENTNGECK